MSHITEVEMKIDSGDFRIIGPGYQYPKYASEQHRYMRGLASWIGFHQTTIEYVREARYAGEANTRFQKSFALALNAITSFSGHRLSHLLFRKFTLSTVISDCDLSIYYMVFNSE